jgi:hypothetical protein
VWRVLVVVGWFVVGEAFFIFSSFLSTFQKITAWSSVLLVFQLLKL